MSGVILAGGYGSGGPRKSSRRMSALGGTQHHQPSCEQKFVSRNRRRMAYLWIAVCFRFTPLAQPVARVCREAKIMRAFSSLWVVGKADTQTPMQKYMCRKHEHRSGLRTVHRFTALALLRHIRPQSPVVSSCSASLRQGIPAPRGPAAPPKTMGTQALPADQRRTQPATSLAQPRHVHLENLCMLVGQSSHACSFR